MAISKEALIQRLTEILKGQTGGEYFDTMGDHKQADSLLLEYIDDEKVTELFQAIDKWYS
jgi:hypothetical protein